MALGLSVSIVLVVIYIFLLDWRATLIPGLSMPVAMIGTIAAIYLAGFSVNILTLAGAGAGHRPGRRRRHRGAGKHRPAPQRGHGPARRGGARHPGSVLRRHRHHRHPGGGVRADLLPARPDRRAVPRVRLRPGDLGGAVLRGGADTLPDAGLAHADRCRDPPWRRRGRTDRRRAARPLPALPACLPRRAAARSDGRGAVCRRGLRAVSQHPPGADADRGPVGGAAQGQRSARRQPRLYDLADAPARGAAAAAARRRRSREHLSQRRPERRLQQRLHGDHARALGRTRPQPAGDHCRHRPPRPPGAEHPRLPDHAQQPGHPRRRQRAAIRPGRQ